MYSGQDQEHGLAAVAKYFGEWSETSNFPHGRGILIYTNGTISIQCLNNGRETSGKYICIKPAMNVFFVGEIAADAAGQRRNKGVKYFGNLPSQEYEQ
jgi:hypothetical protein